VSLLVISLDNTILNVAVPTLERDLGASSSQLQSIVDSYMLVFAGLLMGIGGAFIMPSTLSILTATFPARERAIPIGLRARRSAAQRRADRRARVVELGRAVAGRRHDSRPVDRL
jgi:MFS family permease